jgi:hypothetical protein
VDALTFTKKKPKNCKQTLSAYQMASLFWDRKEVLMVEFMQEGTTITLELYYETPENLCRVIQKNRRGMLTSGIVLLHENTLPHTAVRTRVLLEHFNWELFDNNHYSTDLTPSYCKLFIYLKNWLRSQRFNNNEKLMEVVKT